MLSQETQEQLGKLGVDVSKLTEAITSQEEVSLDVPTLYTEEQVKLLYTEEDKETYGRNRFEAGKNAMSEIKAKDLKSTYGIEIEGKDLDSVVKAIAEKSSVDDGEALKSLKSLQGNYTTLEQEYNEFKIKTQREKELLTLRSELESVVPSNSVLGKKEIIDLYLLNHNIDGGAVKKDGQILKDRLENPIKPTDHLKTWIDERKLTSKTPSNVLDPTDDKGSSGAIPKFENSSEFSEWAKKKGIEPMSSEGLKIYSENRKK